MSALLWAARLAQRGLVRQKLRSLLMMLGVLVGIATLSALEAVGDSTKQETLKRFQRMIGTFDTVVIRPGANRSRGMPSLTNVEPTLRFEDATAIATDLPEIRQVALVQNAFEIDVRARDQSCAPAIFGVSANWTALRGEELASGSPLSEDDMRSLARVAVLGADVASTLFPAEDPLGKTVRVGDVPFEVKGVLRPLGVGPAGGSLDNLIYIPVTTAARRLFNRDYLTMAIAQLKDPAAAEAATGKIQGLLRERHHLARTAADDFTLISPRAAFARVAAVGGILTRVLWGVAALAIVIGGIVIMSLMLGGLAERRQEIGVRRAVGASRRDILLQFLLEALLISTAGGLLGALLGWGTTRAATAIQRLPPTAPWLPLATAVALSLIVGLAAGVHPAWKASQVDPATAVRSQ